MKTALILLQLCLLTVSQLVGQPTIRKVTYDPRGVGGYTAKEANAEAYLFWYQWETKGTYKDLIAKWGKPAETKEENQKYFLKYWFTIVKQGYTYGGTYRQGSVDDIAVVFTATDLTDSARIVDWTTSSEAFLALPWNAQDLFLDRGSLKQDYTAIGEFKGIKALNKKWWTKSKSALE